MTDEKMYKTIVSHMIAAAHDYIRAMVAYDIVDIRDMGKLEEHELRMALNYSFKAHAIDCMKELKGDEK